LNKNNLKLPKLSLELIIALAIENQFEDFVEVVEYNKDRFQKDVVYKCLIEFMENQMNKDNYKNELFLFCIDSFLYTMDQEDFQDLQTRCISTITGLNRSIELQSGDVCSVINKILHKFYKILHLNEWNLVKNDKLKRVAFEFCLKNKL
jgi:hypothetical protein